jgi:hypothetical protein
VNIEVDFCVESRGIRVAGAIDENTGVRHEQTISAQQPLVYLHLALIFDLPAVV